MAVEKTVGVGGNFSDANAALSWLYFNLNPLNDNVILDLVSNFNLSSRMGGCINLGGHYLKLYSDTVQIVKAYNAKTRNKATAHDVTLNCVQDGTNLLFALKHGTI